MTGQETRLSGRISQASTSAERLEQIPTIFQAFPKACNRRISRSFKGRLSLKQCIPSKRNRFGIVVIYAY